MSFFTLENYKNILTRAKDIGYRFITFEDLFGNNARKDLFKANNGLCLLRHDIDASLFAALELSCLERELAITSNYFFMLRSPCYNLLSRFNSDCVRKIIENGHAAELHYDQGYDEVQGFSIAETEASIKREIIFLQETFNRKIHSVSFHQPSQKVLNNKIKCYGRVNTYDKEILKDFYYISDSNRKFEPFNCININEENLNERIYNSLASYFPKNIQLLIHPIWWVIEGGTTQEVWSNVIKQNFIHSQEQLLSTEKAYGKRKKITIT